jgi:hypothetical protein
VSFKTQEVELADNLYSSMTEEENHQSIKEILIRGEPPTTRMRKHTQRLVDERPIAIMTIFLENIEILKLLTKALKGKNNDFWREAAVVEFRAFTTQIHLRKLHQNCSKRLKGTNCKSTVHEQY